MMAKAGPVRDGIGRPIFVVTVVSVNLPRLPFLFSEGWQEG